MVKQSKTFSQINSSSRRCQTTPKLLAGKPMIKRSEELTRSLITTILEDCSSCGVKVPKKLHERWHDCPNCKCSLDRDHNAAVNILNRADGHAVLKAQRLLSNSRIG